MSDNRDILPPGPASRDLTNKTMHGDLVEADRTVSLVIEFDTYGTYEQAAATVQRIRELLTVELGRDIEVDDFEAILH